MFWVVKHKFKKKRILKSHCYQFNGQSLALGSNIKYSSERVWVCVCACVKTSVDGCPISEHTSYSEEFENKLVSGKVPFLASWFGQTNAPIQHFEFCENDVETQKTIREYSANLWPNWDTKFQWESKGSRAPKHSKECPVETTSATAFKVELSYGKVLTRLCLF